MGYDKIDSLAINTIRTLAVSLLRCPNGGAQSAVLPLYAQHQSFLQHHNHQYTC